MMAQPMPRLKKQKLDMNVLLIRALFVWLFVLLFNIALSWRWLSSPDLNAHASQRMMC